MAELMPARKIVGSEIRAFGGIFIEIGSSKAEVALPHVGGWGGCLHLRLRASHSESTRQMR
jgi:hypothetical protein